MDKVKIKNILDKNELTIYDCGSLFREIGTALQGFKDSIILNADYATQDAEGLIENAKKILASLDSWIDRIKAKSNEITEKSEETVAEIRKAHQKIRETIDRMEWPKEFKTPYGLMEFLEVAERCRSLDDFAWSRLVELAKALNK